MEMPTTLSNNFNNRMMFGERASRLIKYRRKASMTKMHKIIIGCQEDPQLPIIQPHMVRQTLFATQQFQRIIQCRTEKVRKLAFQVHPFNLLFPTLRKGAQL